MRRSYCDVVRLQQTVHPPLSPGRREVYLSLIPLSERNGEQVTLVHHHHHWLVVDELVQMGHDASREIDGVTHEEDQGVLLERDFANDLLRDGGGDFILLHFPTVPQLLVIRRRSTHTR